jgi:hypothetical protein
VKLASLGAVVWHHITFHSASRRCCARSERTPTQNTLPHVRESW